MNRPSFIWWCRHDKKIFLPMLEEITLRRTKQCVEFYRGDCCLDRKPCNAHKYHLIDERRYRKLKALEISEFRPTGFPPTVSK